MSNRYFVTVNDGEVCQHFFFYHKNRDDNNNTIKINSWVSESEDAFQLHVSK